MGIFDSIKNAFAKDEETPEVTVSPSQMLRDAGIDPSGLKFSFGTGSIAVAGEIATEADRQKILDVLSTTAGISEVHDNMAVAAPVAETQQAPPAEAPSPDASSADPAAEADSSEEMGETYTVKSGDTLWKIAEQAYGNGSKYKVIFEANKDLLENPDRIFPGQELKIPKL